MSSLTIKQEEFRIIKLDIKQAQHMYLQFIKVLVNQANQNIKNQKINVLNNLQWF